MALAAVGSLARRELGPRSDIDLVLLHDGKHPQDQHAGRPALVSVVGQRHPARPLGPDAGRVRRRRRPRAERRGRPARPQSDRRRHRTGQRRAHGPAGQPGAATPASGCRSCWPPWPNGTQTFGDAAYLLEPDLKEARGGFRDMTMLRALAATWLTDRPHEGLRGPYERLLDVRDALHVTSGRALDRLLLTEVGGGRRTGWATPTRRSSPGGEHGGPADRPCGRADRTRRAPGDPGAPGAELRQARAPARATSRPSTA